jgi:hypothetical protein
MTPNERATILDERAVTDVDQADSALTEWVRAHGESSWKARGVIDASER